MSIIQTGRRALACLALLLGAGTAHASSFAYTSTAGEPLGGGVGTRTLASPNATFSAYANPTHIMLDVDVAGGEHWNIQFNPPHFQGIQPSLRRGSYVNAEHAAFTTAHAPGLEINGPLGNCLDAYGSFKIRQVSFDWQGELERLEATFVHRCGSTTAPVLTGTIFYEALPRSFAYSRTAGSPLGSTSANSYYGDTSDISAGGFTDLLVMNVNGQRDEWRFVATAPQGKQFEKGKTYTLAYVADPVNAGLEIEWNGGYCVNPSGTIKIHNIGTFPDMGEINGLYALLTIYCNGSTVPFKGTIRYNM